MGEDPRAIRNEIEETRERMGDTVEALAYKSDVKSRAKDSVNEKVDNVKEKVVGVKDSVTGKASDVGGTVSDRTPDRAEVKQGAKQAVSVAQQNPVGLALGAVAVGFIAGMLIPSTSVEDEKLGPVADQVKDKAQETGQTALEHGKQVAQDVASTAKDAGQQAVAQTTEAAKSSGQEHAQQVKDEAQDTAPEARTSVVSSPPGALLLARRASRAELLLASSARERSGMNHEPSLERASRTGHPVARARGGGAPRLARDRGGPSRQGCSAPLRSLAPASPGFAVGLAGMFGGASQSVCGMGASPTAPRAARRQCSAATRTTGTLYEPGRVCRDRRRQPKQLLRWPRRTPLHAQHGSRQALLVGLAALDARLGVRRPDGLGLRGPALAQEDREGGERADGQELRLPVLQRAVPEVRAATGTTRGRAPPRGGRAGRRCRRRAR